MSLTPVKNLTLSDLDSWGPLKAIGAEIFEGGDVGAYGRMTFGGPTDAVSSAYFGTDKGRFRLVYPFSEQATIVHGEVRITDESTGQSQVYGAGDTWFVEKGTSTMWEVLSDGFVKHYLAIA